MKKIFISLLSIFVFISPIFAHVTISPSIAGIATNVNFEISVPTEKEIPTIGLKLLIPQGLQEVTPFVKPGWKIETKNDPKSNEITEIDWTNGSILPNLKDSFRFSAQVPGIETNLVWKAYQTYSDGSIIYWDKDPNTISSGDEGTPYSITKVINDITPKDNSTDTKQSQIALFLSAFAIVIGIFCLLLIAINRKKKI